MNTSPWIVSALTAGLLAVAGAGCGPEEVEPQAAGLLPAMTSRLPEAANGEIAFGRGNHVWVVHSDGSGLRRLTTRPPNVRGEFGWTQPAWPADGTRLALVLITYPTHEYGEIVIASATGRPERVVVGPSTSPGSPAWSPAGTELAFAHMSDLTLLNLVDLGTGEERLLPLADYTDERLGQVGVFDSTPAWSPDGKWLSFSRNRFDLSTGRFDWNRSRLYVVRPDGRDLTPLAALSGSDPSWSRDGKRIAFEDRGDLYFVDAAGVHRLTNTRGVSETSPSWSPDGSKLVFERENTSAPRDRNGYRPTDIWTVNANGTGAKKVVADGIGPAWRPLPRR